jgi:PAS domain S-box-containing protein
MGSKRTQKPSSVLAGRSAPNGSEARSKSTLRFGERSPGARRDLFLIRGDDGPPIHAVRLAEEITEPKHAERGIKIVPTTVLAGLGALAALLSLGVLELVLERVLSDAVALSIPVIFGSIAAAGITYFALRRQESSHQRTLGERERAEDARREAERKYRDIFENAVEGIFQTSPDGGFITANPALARMLGFASPEELIREPTDIGRTHYVESGRRVQFERLLDQHDRVQDFEFECYRKDGTKIWMSDNVRTVRDASGKLLYYEGTTEDITERKRAEEELRESEERYRDLIENSRELICTHDLDGLVLSANPAAAAAVGYDLDEFVGKKTIRDLLAPEVNAQFDQYMTRLRKEGTTSGLMLVQTKSGERRVWEYYNSLRTEGVATPIVRGMARDITEQRRAEIALRESEERYRELFENSEVAIYVHDLSGTYTSVNRTAERLSGYAREEIIGKHFWDFVAPEYVKKVRENLCKKLEEVEETNYEVEILTRDGARVPVEVSSRMIYEDGVAVGVQGTARDVTERKRARQALLTYSRRLLEAQEAERGRIARELHDQIGQMLTALKLNLHAIQGAGDAGEARPLIEDTLKMLDEALEQVRDLSVDLRPLLLDDLGLVTALRWFVDHQAQRTGVRAEFISESLDPDLRFSSVLEIACFRIAQEALTNVARHARAKTVTVRLSRNRDSLILLVEDDGAGFEIKTLQGHAQAKATLGLRGMEERAHAVGGRVRIDSATDRGTQVFVELPITMPNARSTIPK